MNSNRSQLIRSQFAQHRATRIAASAPQASPTVPTNVAATPVLFHEQLTRLASPAAKTVPVAEPIAAAPAPAPAATAVMPASIEMPDFDALELKVAALSEQILPLLSIPRLTNDIADLQASSAAQKARFDAMSDSLRAEIESIRADLTAQVETASAKVTELSTKVEIVAADVVTLKSSGIWNRIKKVFGWA